MIKNLVMDKQRIMNMSIDEMFDEAVAYAEGKCVGCGGRATRTNNTLCQACWNDAEGFEDNE